MQLKSYAVNFDRSWAADDHHRRAARALPASTAVWLDVVQAACPALAVLTWPAALTLAASIAPVVLTQVALIALVVLTLAALPGRAGARHRRVADFCAVGASEVDGVRFPDQGSRFEVFWEQAGRLKDDLPADYGGAAGRHWADRDHHHSAVDHVLGDPFAACHFWDGRGTAAVTDNHHSADRTGHHGDSADRDNSRVHHTQNGSPESDHSAKQTRDPGTTRKNYQTTG
ncbi:MAG: hypothetical protein AAFR29_03515 [Pseudomonadota bacterium]